MQVDYIHGNPIKRKKNPSSLTLAKLKKTRNPEFFDRDDTLKYSSAKKVGASLVKREKFEKDYDLLMANLLDSKKEEKKAKALAVKLAKEAKIVSELAEKKAKALAKKEGKTLPPVADKSGGSMSKAEKIEYVKRMTTLKKDLINKRKESGLPLSLKDVLTLFVNKKTESGLPLNLKDKKMSEIEKKLKEGEKAMAKKKASKKKVTKKVAKKATKKVAKKATKKVAKKATKKVAKKHGLSKKQMKRHVATMARHGATLIRKKKNPSKVYRLKARLTKNTKLPAFSSGLIKGESTVGKLTKFKKDKAGHLRRSAVYEAKVKRIKNPIVVSNPIIVSNPTKKHKKRKGHAKKHAKHLKKHKNPIVFSKNPMGAVLAKVTYFNEMSKTWLTVGVVEIAGLGIGAGLDGLALKQFKKIPVVGAWLDILPTEVQAPTLLGGFALVAHLGNVFLGSKGQSKEEGPKVKSKLLEELCAGVIASAIVKAVSYLSNHSGANELMEGYQYTPAMSGANLSGYIHSNPSASMSVGKSDFAGADFQGADFQGADFAGDSVGGADFDGYVSTMGDHEGMDFGSDESAMGSWGE